MDTGIKIGNDNAKGTIEQCMKSIMQIITSANAEVVKIEALKCLTACCEIKNVNISECTFGS